MSDYDSAPGRACRWTRDRLPLLTGGELTGPDRRTVERHLLSCPGCRARRASLDGVLGVLHAAAEVGPPGLETPPAPLWPALERQLREERHAPRRWSWDRAFAPAGEWLDALSTFARAHARPAVVALAAGLTLAALVAARGNLPGRDTRPRPAPVAPDQLFTRTDPDAELKSVPPIPAAEHGVARIESSDHGSGNRAGN